MSDATLDAPHKERASRSRGTPLRAVGQRIWAGKGYRPGQVLEAKHHPDGRFYEPRVRFDDGSIGWINGETGCWAWDADSALNPSTPRPPPPPVSTTTRPPVSTSTPTPSAKRPAASSTEQPTAAKKRPATRFTEQPATAAKTTCEKAKKRLKTASPACIVCLACGRDGAALGDEPLLPVREKLSADTKSKTTIAHIHACCMLRAPPAERAEAQEWWDDFERGSWWPSCKPERRSSCEAAFVPFVVGLDEWMDEFTLYNFRCLLASSRRFKDGRAPPYAAPEPSASLYRVDDPVRALEERKAKLEPQWDWRVDGYEEELYAHGDGSCAEYADLRLNARSGVSLLGRDGIRDWWAEEESRAFLDGSKEAVAAVGQIPLPSDLADFEIFLSVEQAARNAGTKGMKKRSIFTGEHQVQGKVGVLAMLKQLERDNCKGLHQLATKVCEAARAKEALDALQTLNTVGPFVSWQIFSDLVAISPLEPTVLTASAIEDSIVGYALFGPGARKGAKLMEGGAETVAVIEDDQDDSKQGVALARAQRIVNGFPTALERLGLAEQWKDLSEGRRYDLETAEHLLCGWYGIVPQMVGKAVQHPAVLPMMKQARRANGVRGECAAAVPTAGAHSVSSSVKGCKWTPNPCTDLERKEWRETLSTLAKCGAAHMDSAPERRR